MIIGISQIPNIYLTKDFNNVTLKMPFYPNLRRLVKIKEALKTRPDALAQCLHPQVENY